MAAQLGRRQNSRSEAMGESFALADSGILEPEPLSSEQSLQQGRDLLALANGKARVGSARTAGLCGWTFKASTNKSRRSNSGLVR